MQKDVTAIYRRYWLAYGGRSALLCSPYLHGALVLLVLTIPFWARSPWWGQVIAAIPTLLGFTLGGFAVFLSFGDAKFRALLAEPDEEEPDAPSLYVSLCATFVHFILVQCLAMSVALIAQAWSFQVTWPFPLNALAWCLSMAVGALGYGLFLYTITLVLAATMHVFRVATWYEEHRRSELQDQEPK